MVEAHDTHTQAKGESSPAAATGSGGRLLLDGFAALALVGLLAGVYAFDLSTAKQAKPPEPITVTLPKPPKPPEVDPASLLPPPDATPRLKIHFYPEVTGPAVHSKDNCVGKFGLMTATGNPEDDNKPLTYREPGKPYLPVGETNNTLVKVDGAAATFGSKDGTLVQAMSRRPDGRVTCLWEFRQVEVEQVVELVLGDTSRRTDTAQITYRLQNRGDTARKVGLRILLDTLIGNHDGVPFLVPGREELVTGPVTLKEKVPAFIQALENDDVQHPGVVADLGGLRTAGGVAPDRVVLSGWPEKDLTAWDYRLIPFVRADNKNYKDSAIGLYYDPKELDPKGQRRIRFTYGLGTINRGDLYARPMPESGGEFYLVALIQRPTPGLEIELVDFPKELTLTNPSERKKPVVLPRAGEPYTKVDWLVKAAPNFVGKLEVKARLTPGNKELRTPVTVQPRNPGLRLVTQKETSKRGFWVQARISDPKEDQTIELNLEGPSGVTLNPSTPPRQKVPPPDKNESHVWVHWFVDAEASAEGEVKLSAHLQPGEVRDQTTERVERATIVGN